MKILRTRFKNINSFYDEHPGIDFSTSPLVASGLFIISGPTGAGKSTLLDVITLALYNEIPRLGNISKTEIEKLGSIVNLKAADEPKAEAYAEVEYEVKGKQYRSKWSIARNRNGNWNNYQMEIAELPSGNLLDVKGLANFPKKNEELIGLSYQQFVKSIILAQGSFAEFLRAKAHERSKLLEDITGERIYRQLGSAAFLRDKELKEQLDLKEKELQLVSLLTDEEVAQLNRALQIAETHRTQIDKEVAFWEKEKSTLDRCLELRQKIEKLEHEKIRLAQQQELFAADALRLRRHELVSVWAADLATLKARQTQLTQREEQKQTLQSRIAIQDKILSETVVNIHQLIGRAVPSERLVSELSAFEGEILGLETDIEKLNAEIRPVFAATKQEVALAGHAWLKTLALEKLDDTYALLKQKQEELQSEVRRFSPDFDAENELARLAAREKALIGLVAKLEKRDDLMAQGQETKNTLAHSTQLVAEKRPLLAQLNADGQALEAKLKQLQLEKEKELKKFNLKDLRRALQSGEECPLCGSTHHPYVHAYVSALSQLQLNLDLLEDERKQLDSQRKELEAVLHKAEALAAKSEADLAKLREAYRLAKEESEKGLEMLALSPETTIDRLLPEQKQLGYRRDAINHWLKVKELNGIVQKMLGNYEELFVLRGKKGEKEQEKQQRYTGKDIRAEGQLLKNTLTNAQTTLDIAQTSLAEVQVRLAEDTRQKAALETSLIGQLAAKGIENIEQACDALLPAKEVERLNDARKMLEDQEKNIEINKKALLEQLRDTTQLRKTDHSLEETAFKLKTCHELRDQYLREVSGAMSRLMQHDAQKVKFAGMQAELDQMRLQRKKWDLLNRYIGDREGNKFSNFAQNLTLSNLIGLANRRLRHLSDRYVLDKPKDETDSLFVIDTYQGNTQRAVNTLSGGETFTLSLALALALSDLASHHVRIESLFIDEGFGTLDPDSLDMAMSMLERLQSESDKTIGIISHVEALKERIGTQIRLFKNANGLSTMEIVS